MFFSVLLLIAVGWGMVDNDRARRWYVITILVVVYAICLSLSLFYGGWVGIAPIIVLCATLYAVYLLSVETTRLLDEKATACSARIEKAGTTDDGTNVPLQRAEKEHYRTQMVMLAFVPCNQSKVKDQHAHSLVDDWLVDLTGASGSS